MKKTTLEKHNHLFSLIWHFQLLTWSIFILLGSFYFSVTQTAAKVVICSLCKMNCRINKIVFGQFIGGLIWMSTNTCKFTHSLMLTCKTCHGICRVKYPKKAKLFSPFLKCRSSPTCWGCTTPQWECQPARNQRVARPWGTERSHTQLGVRTQCKCRNTLVPDMATQTHRHTQTISSPATVNEQAESWQ